MWNTFQTDAHEGMTAKTIGITGHGGKPIHAYYSRPIGEGPFPDILLIHHMPGWDEYTREAARRFTAHGYSVICPNLYEDFGHGTPDEVVGRAREQGGMVDKDVMEDCGGALNFLRSQPNANGKVGVIGMCSGGRHTFLAAYTLEGIDCTVDCCIALSFMRAQAAPGEKAHGGLPRLGAVLSFSKNEKRLTFPFPCAMINPQKHRKEQAYESHRSPVRPRL